MATLSPAASLRRSATYYGGGGSRGPATAPRALTRECRPRVSAASALSAYTPRGPSLLHLGRAPRRIAGVEEGVDGTGVVVLVTGANSGIGLEASRQLVQAGCTVLVAARSAVKAEAAAAATGGEPVVLDLGDLASVRRWGRAFAASGRALNAIVCNAGVAPDREGAGVGGGRDVDAVTVRRTAQGFEETIGVNHLGHFALVKELLPSLRAASHARIVVTSGEIHNAESPDGKNGAPPSLGDLAGLASGPSFTMCDGGEFDGNKAYKDSKLCGVLFARELSRRLATLDGNVVCNAFSPGFVPTSELFRNQSAPVRALLRYAFNYPPLATSLPTAGMLTMHMVLGRETGQTSGLYYCGSPDYYKAGESAGIGFLRGIFRPEFGAKEPSVEARDDGLAKRLWELSEELTGAKY